jgi:transcriptional regulator NrdR family protein
MKIRLKVVKADGSVEEYLHTKVIGTISNALAYDGQADIGVAEELAEVVTYFLYHGKTQHTVTSGEIFSIIKAVLTATTYEDAAIVLTEHHFNRKLKRSRTEVVSIDIQQLADAEMLYGVQQSPRRSRWDKSKIVNDLVTSYDVSRQTARTIASMVEEKILSMGLTSVPASLIKQLVLGDAAAFLRAQRQLQTV